MIAAGDFAVFSEAATALPPVLLVSDGHDEDLCRCAEAMRTSGVNVAWAGDVYSAMSRLSDASGRWRVVVDVRPLDEQELAFLQLAPRYHSSVELFVPLLPAAADRLNGLRGRFQTVTLAALVDLAMGIRAATPVSEEFDGAIRLNEAASIARRAGEIDTADAPEVDQPLAREPAPVSDTVEAVVPSDGFASPQGTLDTVAEDEIPEAITIESMDDEQPASPVSAPSRLSTDGGIRGDAFERSLHEEVRRRMSGGVSPVRTPRKPPPPPGSAALPAGALGEARVSPEELDALLRDGISEINLIEPDDGSPAGGR